MKKRLSKLTALVLSLVLALSIVPASAATPSVSINLDGVHLKCTGTQPTIKSGRTMIPIRPLAEALGAVVGWDPATRQVTLTRANTTIIMTVGSKTAYVNGQPMDMAVAPYIEGGRTMIPARYVAEFFGQIVTWDGTTRRVYVTEDKSVAEGSNLEAWALPMGSMLSYLNWGKPDHFGLYARSDSSAFISNEMPFDLAQSALSGSWSIENREDLIETVASMTVAGHNINFLVDAALVNSLSASEYKQLLANATGMDAYMWPYTKQLSEKWGDRGILCWDLFRMSNLVQWGYNAGYVTYAEALALLEPAATLLCANFSSWEEAYENYLDGYNWWARNNVLGEDIWQTERGVKYAQIKESYGQIFDDSLFKTGVLPVPGLSIDDVIATLPDSSID